jgi:hypothetical protein
MASDGLHITVTRNFYFKAFQKLQRNYAAMKLCIHMRSILRRKVVPQGFNIPT